MTEDEARIPEGRITVDEPRGNLVRDAFGRYYFLPEAESARFLIDAAEPDTLNKIWDAAGRVSLEDVPDEPLVLEVRGGRTQPMPTPRISCAAYLNWLDHHNPNTVAWRRVSIMWLNDCLGG